MEDKKISRVAKYQNNIKPTDTNQSFLGTKNKQHTERKLRKNIF